MVLVFTEVVDYYFFIKICFITSTNVANEALSCSSSFLSFTFPAPPAPATRQSPLRQQSPPPGPSLPSPAIPPLASTHANKSSCSAPPHFSRQLSSCCALATFCASPRQIKELFPAFAQRGCQHVERIDCYPPSCLQSCLPSTCQPGWQCEEMRKGSNASSGSATDTRCGHRKIRCPVKEPS